MASRKTLADQLGWIRITRNCWLFLAFAALVGLPFPANSLVLGAILALVWHLSALIRREKRRARACLVEDVARFKSAMLEGPAGQGRIRVIPWGSVQTYQRVSGWPDADDDARDYDRAVEVVVDNTGNRTRYLINQDAFAAAQRDMDEHGGGEVPGVPAGMRDPVWLETVATIRARRGLLVDTVERIQQRVDAAERTVARMTVLRQIPELVSAEADLGIARDELTLAARVLPQRREDWARWAAIDRDEVIQVPRETRLTCDCRFGHFGEHLMVGRDEDGILRECLTCEPPTRWRETGSG